MASSDVQTIRKAKNPPEQYRNAPELTQPPGPYSTHGKTGCTIRPVGDWVQYHPCPIQQHTSTQSIPWPSSCSLTTSTSILDLPWASPTRHLQGWLASTCLRPNDLEMFRHTQGCPDSSQLCPSTPGTSRPPPDHLQITHRSSAAVQEPLKHLEKLKTGKLRRFWCQPGHPVHRAGGCHHGSHLPLYMWCMYVTSPPIRLHQRCPVGLPFIPIRRPEWMVHPRGWRFLVDPAIPAKPRRKPPGIYWNKPDLTGWNSTSPKCVPNTHLPLSELVNHNYWIEHKRAPLSH